MQVFLQPLREVPQPDTGYARERAAAQAAVAAQSRARQRYTLGAPLRLVRKFTAFLRRTPQRAARLTR